MGKTGYGIESIASFFGTASNSSNASRYALRLPLVHQDLRAPKKRKAAWEIDEGLQLEAMQQIEKWPLMDP
jgi:hypothetical protein